VPELATVTIATFPFRDIEKGSRVSAFLARAFAWRFRNGLRQDLKKFDVPTLIIHGDQIVPIGASAMLSSKLVKNTILKIYPGGSHSLGDTSKDQLNADLLAFLKS
jgi:pimeloyl-ACP methyl ester carboxylesterase